jgi:hypothetical protein
MLAMSGRSEDHVATHSFRTPDGMLASALSWIVVPGESVVELPTIRRSENTGNPLSCAVGALGDLGPHAAKMAVRMKANGHENLGLVTQWCISRAVGPCDSRGPRAQAANLYFLTAEQLPSIFFTDDTRIRCEPSAAPAIFPEPTSPSAGATLPATSTRCPSSLPNSASWPVSA